MEKTNLSVGDVINIMEFGEFAVITSEEKAKLSPMGHRIMQPPSVLYFDEKDDGILKSTDSGQAIMIGKTKANPHRYKIVDSEGYVKYLLERMTAGVTKEDEERADREAIEAEEKAKEEEWKLRRFADELRKMMEGNEYYYTKKYRIHQDMSDWDTTPYWISVRRVKDNVMILSSDWDNPEFNGTEEEYQDLVQILAEHDEVTGG